MLKIGLIFLAAIACGTGYLFTPHFQMAREKCPDEYANDAAGSASFMEDIDTWTEDFYAAHPSATLPDWSAARYQFWIDHKCTAALQRYDQAKAGKADPTVMQKIQDSLDKKGPPIRDTVSVFRGGSDLHQTHEKIREKIKKPSVSTLPHLLFTSNFPFRRTGTPTPTLFPTTGYMGLYSLPKPV